MATLKYLDPITGQYKPVSSGGGGTSIPASDTEPTTGNYWLDTSEEGGTYYTAGEVDNMLAALPAGLTMDLLWENPDRTVGLGAQSIPVDCSDADFVVGVCMNGADHGGNIVSFCKVGEGMNFFGVYGTTPHNRRVFIYEDHIQIEDVDMFKSYNTTGDPPSNDQGRILPLYFYKIKSTVTGGTPVTPENVYTKDEIDELLATVGGGMGMDLLWENEDPTASFAAQTVEMDLSQYKFVSIVYHGATAFETFLYKNTGFIPVGTSTELITITKNYPKDFLTRTADISQAGVVFSDGNYVTYSTGAISATANGYSVPVAIYGIKAVSSNSASETEDLDHPGCFYRTVNGVQEWLNPPMEIGVEYKTTERYAGKHVYVSALNFGVLPNKENKTVNLSDLGINNVSGVIHADLIDSSGMFVNSHEGITNFTASALNISITTNIDYSAHIAVAILKYIKTTD